MQTTTHLFRRQRKSFLLTGIFLLMVGWLQATTYYSVPSATDFNNVASWVTATNGLSGTNPGSISNADDFVIQNSSVMTLSGSASVRSLVINAGTLNVGANTLTVAIAAQFNSAFTINSGGRFNLTGGTVIVNGAFTLASGGRFDQSAGTLKVDGNDNGNVATSVASGTNIVGFTASVATNLNLTGGSIIIVDPHVVNSNSLGRAFAYLGSVSMALGVNHTFQLGDGVSTDATANTGGFVQETYVGSTRVLYGNLIINIAGSGNRTLVTQQYTTQYVGVQKDLTITAGDYRNTGVLSVAGNTVVNGTLTTTGTFAFANSSGTGTLAPATVAQSITGSGSFRNLAASPTANFAGLTVNNNSTGGVTFLNANSVLSGTSTGTVSGTLTFTQGLINSTNTFIQGISTASAGTLSWTSGGFASGTTFRRWVTTTTITTAASATANFFPMVSGTSSRMVRLNRNTTGSTNVAGWVECTHTNTAGLTADGYTDGAYVLSQRTNSLWLFASGGGYTATGNIHMALCGDGLIVTAAAPSTAPRIMQVGAAAGTHLAATGTSAIPFGCRTFTGAASTPFSGSQYLGINTADIGLYSVASAAWNVGSTWSTGSVPTSSDNPLITSGTTVTVNAAAAAALTVAVNGTLVVSGNTLTVTGASGTGISLGAGGVLNVSGGTINIGPQDNSFCNRTLNLGNGSTLNLSSGTINLAGNLATTSGMILNQSGGNFNVDGNANNVTANSTSSVLFNLNVSSLTSVNLTGGTLTFIDPPANAVNTITLSGSLNGNVNVTSGHTIRFGDGTSSTAASATAWNVNTWSSTTGMVFGNVIVNGPTGTNRFVTSTYQQPILGDFTINTGGDSRIASPYVAGSILVNGTLTTSGTLGFITAGFLDVSSLVFSNATGAQTIGGSGTIQNLTASPTGNLANLIVQNSNATGVTLNVPLSVTGSITLNAGKVNTTLTNILTHKSTTSGNTFTGATTAGYVSGPMIRVIPASSTNFTAWLPVGKTASNWLAIFNATTNAGGPVSIQAETNNSVGLPNTFIGIVSLNPNREWVTSIASGSANFVSYSVQGHDAAMVSGNTLVGIQSPATDFSILGSGSTFNAGSVPLGAFLANPPPVLAASTFPDRIAFGQTGPLDVAAVSINQTGVAAISATTNVGATNVNQTRMNIQSVGSTGTITLTDCIFNFTGTAAPSEITSATLWTGTFGAPVAQIGGAVSVVAGQISFTGLTTNIASGSNYFWVRFNVSGTAIIGNTLDLTLDKTNLTFTLAGGATNSLTAGTISDAGNVLIDYCLPVFTNACSSLDYLTAFSLNTISTTPNCPGALPNNYALNAATTTLQQGNAYTANFTTGSGGAQGVGIWFDFNRDGDFLDAGEFFGTAGTTAASSSGTLGVTIDPLAFTGPGCRMRVMNRYNTTFVQTDVCLNPINYGTVVDYSVTIASPTPRSLNAITSVQQTGGMGASSTNNNLLRVDLSTTGSLGTITLTQAKFTYTGVSSADIAALGVSLWTGTSAAPTAQIGTSQTIAAGVVNFTGLSVSVGATSYLWLRVNTSAGAVIGNLVDAKIVAGDMSFTAAGGATATGSQPSADVDPAGNRYIDYCTPTYSSGCSSGDEITNVSMNGASINLSNSSGCSASPYYTYFSAVNKPDLFQGSTYNLSATFGSDGNQYLGVWIDFNNDGVFATTEFFGSTTSPGGGGTSTISIVVPIAGSTGNLRMRVRGGNDSQLSSNQACGASSSGYGETEDYIVTILPPPNCSTLLPFPATAATASPTSVCAGSSVNFGITVPMPVGLGITYQWRRNGVAFGVPQTSASVSLPVTLSGNYDVEVKCNGTTQVTSSTIAITAYNPQVLGVTNGTRCGIGSVNLNATSSAGSDLRYYDASTGGTLLATRTSGVAYATATLPGPSSTNYYVEAFTILGSGTSGAVSPAIGSFGTSFNGVYQVFTTSAPVKILSIDLFPTAAGTAQIELQDNLGNTVLSYSQVITAGDANSTGSFVGTPLTVPLNFDVPVGTDWQLVYVTGPVCLRNSAGAAGYYGTPSNNVTFTDNWVGSTSYWYNLYNWQIEKSCSSVRSLVTATVTAAPSISTTPTTSVSICEGDATTLQVSSTNLTYVYTWTPGPVVGSSVSVSPITTTSYTVNGVTSLGCTNSKTITVRVNPKPATPTSVTSIPSGSPITFCPNTNGTFTPVQINATATPLVTTLFFDDFAFGAGLGWQTAFTQVVPAEVLGALSRWTFPSAPPAYTYPGYPQTFNSTGSFAVAIGDAQGASSSGATATLTSPNASISISSAATSVVLTYDVSYNAYPADVFQVLYSTDNLTWTPIAASVLSDATDVPTTLGDFQTMTVTIPPAAYAGGVSNFRIRFSYYSEWGYWVAVDNVQVNETISTPQFSFSPAGGLFNDVAASSAYVANTPVSTVYAAPFNNSVYSVKVTNPGTGCQSNALTLPVNVCSVVTDQICNAASVTVLDAPPASLASVVNRTNLGAPITGSLAGLCTLLKSDVWYKSVIPASGDIHVYTFDANNAVTTFDLDSTVVAIYSSSDGTCTGTLTQLGCDAFNGVDGHTYVSASGLTPGSNVFIRVGSRQANIAPPVGFFKLLVMSGLYWSGNAGDYVFLNPSNWYGGDLTTTGILPSISKSIIIPQSATNNYPYVIGTQDVHGINFYYNTLTANAARITIDPAAKLRINSSLQRGGFVSAQGNPFILANPHVAGTGVLEFVNTNVNPLYNIHNINTPSTSYQIIIEGALGVKTNAQLNSNGKLSFINNSVLLSGGVKTTNPSYNYGGTVNGSIIYRRSGSVYGMYDYWSSPISNGNTTCLATSYGSNLYTYNNTAPGAGANVQLGWGTALSPSTAMQIGRGYIQTYAGNGNVVFNGLPNQVSFDYTPTITGANNFNLIGNPFPSSLKINELRARGTNSGTLGSIYLWNQSGNIPFSTGDYVVINSSNLAAGGTPPSGYSVAALELGACQAFMTDVQNTNDITFSCEDRVPTYPVNSTQFFDVTSNISLVRLDLKNSVGTAVNTVVAFSETSSDQFVGGEDSPRMPGTTGFDIYSKLDNQDLVIQMFSPLQATRIVDLGTSMTTNGEYTISMTEYVDFDPSTRVFLEDRATGTFQGLNSNPNYTFTTDPSFQGVRFRLHFMAPVNMASSSTCVGETNGKLIVSNSNMAYPMTAVLKNNNGETVSNSGQFVGEHIFQNLSSGSYTVDMSYVDGSVFSLSSNIGVSGVLSPASFIASSNTVQLADAIIEFAATAPGATEFIWNFGDGTIETTSATPVHAYMQPGIYTVTLTALSGGCSSTATSVVSVTDNTTGIANVGNSKGFSIYPNPANEAAKLLLNVDLKDAQATISITDAAGRLVNKHNLTNLRSGAIVELDINGLANGVYEVSIDSKNFRSVGRLTIAK